MRIESGPTTERMVRSTLMLLMFGGFAAWFGYDGLKGYPHQNHEEFLKQIPAERRETARHGPIYEGVRDSITQDRVQRALLGCNVGDRKKVLADLFGGPPSYEDSEAIYYFGPAY